jgi:hypothetical protein
MTQIIDLGKLRFYWAGEYNSATVYEVNDIVKYGGNVYIYTYTLAEANHTPTDTNYWALMISGLKFEGEYNNATTYQVGDGVAYGGIVYIAVADTTGNPPPNATYWSQFADGIQYEGSYSGATAYQMNDVVTYGAKSYIAKQLTTGNVPTNATYWDILTEGVRGLGNYANGTTYLPGDVISYGGNVYINILTSVGNLPTNATYWSLMNSGIKYIGAYSGGTAYKINELVTYGAKLYVAKAATTGNLPTDGTYWDLLVDGISAEGVYNNGTAYVPGDVVAYGANLYIAIDETTGNIPTNATYWSLFVDSIQSVGTYAGGTTYYIGDIVKYGANLYICKLQSTGNLPTNETYFDSFIESVVNAGEWEDSTTYYAGDIVEYGPNRYVALRQTIADNPDTSASDWEIFTEGINLRANWGTSTTYYINDIVVRGGSTYICLLRHASGTFQTDLDANKWTKFNGGVRWRGEWAGNTAYLRDDLVYNGVSTYIATADFTSDATDFENDTDWDLLSLGADTLPNQVGNDGKFLSTNGTSPLWADSGSLESLTVGEALEVKGDILSRGDVTVSSRLMNVVNKIKTNNVATLTTDENHYFDSGDSVVIAGMGGDFDGVTTISATPSNTTFTYTKAGANVGSAVVTGGTATVTGILSTTGNATVGSNLTVSGDASVAGDLYVGTGAAAFETSAALTDTIAVGAGNANAFVQYSITNLSDGTEASTDFIAYADNGDNDSGWIDMGITSSTFDAEIFGITGKNDGYIFMSAPAPTAANVSNKVLTNNVVTLTTSAAHGFSTSDSVTITGVDATFNGVYTITGTTSNTFTYAKTAANVVSAAVSPVGVATRYTGAGNLVLATDANGSENKIVFAAGGLESANEQMSITPDQNVHIEIATASTNATTGALTVVGGIGSNGDVSINGTFRSEDPIFIGTGAEAFESSATLTAAMMVINNSDNAASSSFSQIAFRNADATSSTDIIAYMDNGNDSNGWMGMGIAGSAFDDTTYGITAPGDGYIFHNAINADYTGNMVFATGAEGSENKLVFAAGGFDSGLTQMEITPGVNVHIEIDTPSTSPTTGALTVVGGVGISGDLNIQGNVDIEGTIVFGGAGTTVETSNLSVSDPFIFVGAGNPADILDLGFLAERSITVSAITETVTNKALTNNVATITTTGSHTYRVGDTVVVASVDATFDGTYAITGVTSNTFTYAKTAANVASVADTGTTSVEKRRVYDGIARDATDNVVKFFQNLVVKPTSTVNFAEAGVTYADIKVDDIDADAITGTGNLTIATDKLIVNAASGAVTVANTFSVTGIATLNGGINSSGSLNFTGGASFSGTTDVQELRETVANPSIASNAATLDWTTGNIFYTDASGAGASITYNVTNVPTDVNKIMTINIFQVQGGTGRIPGVFQIDGSAQTIKWVGGSAPTPTSSAGKIDVFSFTMHRLSGGTWNVYGSSSLNF